jgi:hypothetical protein
VNTDKDKRLKLDRARTYAAMNLFSSDERILKTGSRRVLQNHRLPGGVGGT